MENNATIAARPQALVVGLDRAIAAAPTLLSRAGFEVTLITPQPELHIQECGRSREGAEGRGAGAWYRRCGRATMP